MESDVTKSFDADNAHHTIEKPVSAIPMIPLSSTRVTAGEVSEWGEKLSGRKEKKRRKMKSVFIFLSNSHSIRSHSITFTAHTTVYVRCGLNSSLIYLLNRDKHIHSGQYYHREQTVAEHRDDTAKCDVNIACHQREKSIKCQTSEHTDTVDV